MRRIINGKTYETSTATKLWQRPTLDAEGSDFWTDEGLYRSRDGVLFWAGRGGKLTHYAGGEGIVPVVTEEEIDMLIKQVGVAGAVDVLEQIGSSVEDVLARCDADAHVKLSLRIPASLSKRVEAAAKEEGKKVNRYLWDMIEAELDRRDALIDSITFNPDADTLGVDDAVILGLVRSAGR